MNPAATAGGFTASSVLFTGVLAFLGGAQAAGLSHGELEAHLDTDGRALLRQLFQDHLDLRAQRESRLDEVTGADGVTRKRAETGHTRPLATVFGEVTVTRIAYRAPGQANLHPADGLLNLPEEKQSHSLRRLAALESARGSFSGAMAAIERATGQRIGKRQVEDLAQAAAADVDSFYTRARPAPGSCPGTDVLALSADGAGITMRPEALRPRTRQAAAARDNKLATRLSRGEVRHRKRIAEVGTVYDITPAPRTPADIIRPAGAGPPATKTPGPAARSKWLTASVKASRRQVIADLFNETERRDPAHARTRIALVDGDAHQIARITAEAADRNLHVTIIIDFIHVLEYLWKAAWCLHPEADPAAETWVADQASLILAGHHDQAAATIRDAAAGLTPARRKTATSTATYLTSKSPYLDYPTALKRGWPIATGVIEGACRHLPVN